MDSIFSTYSTGENRITASILAVLRTLSLDRIQRILRGLLEETEFELIRFENQPSKGGVGVPDAIIQSSIRLLLETKTVRDSVRKDQIVRHLERLNVASETNCLLLVLTPDEHRPALLDEIQDKRIAWASFAMLDQVIDEILEDKYEVVSEREAYLLRELQNMLTAEGLLASPTDVLIIPARAAWSEYRDLHAYICQPSRSFQQVKYLGFYSQNQIYPLIPRILESFEEVEMKRAAYKGHLGSLVDRLVEEDLRQEGEIFKILILSAPDSDETIQLSQPIPNDKKSQSGKRIAFTMNQRYVSSEALCSAKSTSDLE